MSFELTRPIRFARQDTERQQFDLLFYLGYFDDYVLNRSNAEQESFWNRITEDEFDEGVKAYQRFCGLTVDGDWGPKTREALTKRFCSVPDVRYHPSEQRAAAGRPRWPMDRVTFTIVNDSGVTVDFKIFESAMAHTIKAWNSVCGIQLETWEKGEPGPNIYGYSRRIDGGSGTLAWSMLAYAGMPATSQLEQRYDQERWYFNDSGQNESGINLGAVMAHEVGHALGLNHISANFAKALLNPFYDPAIVKPQKADISVMVGYYGDPKQPPEPPDPDDPTFERARVKIGESIYVGRLRKLKEGEVDE